MKKRAVKKLDSGGIVKGKSHANGGEHFIVNGSGQHVELEGREAVISSNAFRDTKTYKYRGTNWDVLNQINQKYGGNSLYEEVESIGVGDFVICINSVEDETVREYTGTNEQVISAINESGGCVSMTKGAKVKEILDGRRSKKMKEGGAIERKHDETYQKWRHLVNMSASELERFYDSEEGKKAGLTASEAKKQGIGSGRQSARWILRMKKTPKSEWTPEMWKWAGRQVSFISRMSGNEGPLYDDKGRKTRKHLSLLIWGNNPEKNKAGGRTIAQTPAPASDRIKGSRTNKPKSAESSSSAKNIVLSEATTSSIQTIIDKHNEKHPSKKITLSVAKAVVRRGMGAYSSSHRPTISGGAPNSRVAWGLARLKAFVYKAEKGDSKSGKYSQDNDLLDELGIKHSKFHLGGDMSKHLASNGKPSNLTHEQWHLVRTPAFKDWFGDWENDPANASKVVDENGEPLVVYHATRNKFSEFSIIAKYGNLRSKRNWSIGSHFGNIKQAKSILEDAPNPDYYSISQYFLNIRNLERVSDYQTWTSQEWQKNLIELGYIKEKKTDYTFSEILNVINKNKLDGFVYANTYEGHGDSYVVLNPNQIKLADGSNTTFDGNNPDIRYMKGGKAEGMSLIDIAKYHKVNMSTLLKQYNKGVKHEMEHTSSRKVASQIAKDHIYERVDYYDMLDKAEKTLADGGNINWSEYYAEGGRVGLPPKRFLDENGVRRIDRKSIDELTKYVNSLPQTKSMYFDEATSSYSKERKKLHADIINSYKDSLVCIENENPIAILMGGSPASGKSSFLKKYAPYLLEEEIFKIDADDIRSKLPEYQGWNATQTHLETKDIVNTIISDRNVGIPCNFDLIYDGTMNNTKSYIPLIDLLKKRGYRIFIVYIDKVPKNVVEERALLRYQKSGRFVPLEVIDDFFNKGKAAFNDLKNKVNGYMVVDGSSPKFEIVEEGGIKLPKDRAYGMIGTKITQASIPDTYKTGGAVQSGKKYVSSADKEELFALSYKQTFDNVLQDFNSHLKKSPSYQDALYYAFGVNGIEYDPVEKSDFIELWFERELPKTIPLKKDKWNSYGAAATLGTHVQNRDVHIQPISVPKAPLNRKTLSFTEQVKMLAPFVTSDMLRPAMTGVYVGSDDASKTMIMAATNGNLLVVTPIGGSFPQAQGASILKPETMTPVEVKGEIVPATKYPNFAQVIPRASSLTLLDDFDTRMLLMNLKGVVRANKFWSDNRFANFQVRIEKNGTQWFYNAEMLYQIVDYFYKTTMSGSKLRIEFLDNGHLTIKPSKSIHGDNWIAVLTPMTQDSISPWFSTIYTDTNSQNEAAIAIEQRLSKFKPAKPDSTQNASSQEEIQSPKGDIAYQKQVIMSYPVFKQIGKFVLERPNRFQVIFTPSYDSGADEIVYLVEVLTADDAGNFNAQSSIANFPPIKAYVDYLSWVGIDFEKLANREKNGFLMGKQNLLPVTASVVSNASREQEEIDRETQAINDAF